MRLVLGVVLLGLGSLAAVAATYLVVTGSNLPWVLGRAFTRGGGARLERAPAAYFRAMGALVGSAAMGSFWLVLLVTLSPETSPWAYLLAALAGIPIAAAMTASVAWMTVLAHRYKLFIWSKP